MQSSLTVESGGTAWVGHGGMDWELGRRDERGWVEWGTADGVPMRNNYRDIQELTVASPDGSVWLSPTDNTRPSSATDYGCGLGHFDGDGLTVILEAVCFGALDIAPDGTVWALGERRRQGGALYVITPEGVMAARSSPRTQGPGAAESASVASEQGGEGGSP